MEFLLSILMFAGFMFLILGIFWLFISNLYRENSEIARSYLMKNGYRVIEMEPRYFCLRKGPFWFSHAGQPVFFAIVEDQTGHQKRAWVRCGSYHFGRWNEKFEIKITK